MMLSTPVGPSLRPATRQLLSTSRAFSTTPTVLSNQIPPESPSYIRLPTPPQSDEPKYKRVRGYLPVPRDLFPRKLRPIKTRKEWVERAAQKPSPETLAKPKSRIGEWKAKMADSRRTNLDSGLKALWERRQVDEERAAARSRKNYETNRAAMLAPEREDERFTRGTVLDAMLDTKLYPDPERFARADAARQKIQAVEKGKEEARRDALMELYINAANFITTERELKTEIDTIFAENYFQKQGGQSSQYGATENVWGVYGKQQTTANMLHVSSGASTRVLDVVETEYDRSAKRQKRIAEEFTGGKME